MLLLPPLIMAAARVALSLGRRLIAASVGGKDTEAALFVFPVSFFLSFFACHFVKHDSRDFLSFSRVARGTGALRLAPLLDKLLCRKARVAFDLDAH